MQKYTVSDIISLMKEIMFTNSDSTIRVQTKVTKEKKARYKAAAAMSGLTLERWLEMAADEKLKRDSAEQ